MSIKKKLISTASLIRNSAVGETLARAWHQFVPPISVWKRIYGLEVCLDLRDSLIYLATPAEKIEELEGFDRMLAGVEGHVWDVGCNVGIFSLYAASRGHPTAAFDISPKAISLLNKSAKRNALKNINTVARALSVKPFSYTPPKSADVINRAEQTPVGATVTSMTYLEAEAEFGTPRFVKIDIEGAEEEFLHSREFADWVKSRGISVLMELHKKEFWAMLWPDIPHVVFDEGHVLVNPTGRKRN